MEMLPDILVPRHATTFCTHAAPSCRLLNPWRMGNSLHNWPADALSAKPKTQFAYVLGLAIWDRLLRPLEG